MDNYEAEALTSLHVLGQGLVNDLTQMIARMNADLPFTSKQVEYWDRIIEYYDAHPERLGDV